MIRVIIKLNLAFLENVVNYLAHDIKLKAGSIDFSPPPDLECDL